MNNLPDVLIQTDGGKAKPEAVQRHFDPHFGGAEFDILAIVPTTQKTVFEQLSSTLTWQRLVRPRSGGNHRTVVFQIPTHFAAWKAPRLVVSPEAASAKWSAEWICSEHIIMRVDSDLLSLYADLLPNIFLRSEPEGESVLLFEPTLSAQPNGICRDTIRVVTDTHFEQVPFTLIVDVCGNVAPDQRNAWMKALTEIHRTPIVRHAAEKILFHNDSNGATALKQLHFAHIGNALLIRVECSASAPMPFDSCELYLGQGKEEKSLFLSVAHSDLIKVRPGWFVIPMSSIVSPASVLAATRLPAFLDGHAALSASEHNISVKFSGQATNVAWEATFYWQHVNLLLYCTGYKGVYFV